jgi:hypothetical protein
MVCEEVKEKTVQFVRQMASAGPRVLVNNRAEGNTPFTVERLARMFARG